MYNNRTTFSPQRFVPDRNPEHDWIKYVKEEIDQPGLIVREVDEIIGKGVFTERKFRSGSFLLEYHGEIISSEEAHKRERSYPTEYGSFLLYFKSGRTLMCADATFSSRIGRFVNDGIGDKRNAELRVVHIEKKPHVLLFACKTISQGEEIRFDYGVKELPWRSACLSNNFNKTEKKSVTQNHLIKECTVSLRTLDIGAKEWYYEKEDGTSSCLKISGYQPPSDKEEEENVEGHIRYRGDDNRTLCETTTSFVTDTDNDRYSKTLLVLEKTIDTPEPENGTPSCQSLGDGTASLTLEEMTATEEPIMDIRPCSDEEISGKTSDLPYFYATKLSNTDEGLINEDESEVYQASTSLGDEAASLTLEETTATEEPIKDIRPSSDEEISGNATDLPYFCATKLSNTDEGLINEDESEVYQASTSLGDEAASLTLEETTATEEPIKDIRPSSDEEISGNATDLPYFYATKLSNTDERLIYTDESAVYQPSTSTDFEIANKDGNEEEDNVHYYISVEEGHSSTPEKAIEMNVQIVKAEGITVNVVPHDMELEKATDSQPGKIEPVVHIRTNSKGKKPHRPCPFCYCFKSALSKHLAKKHKDKIEVKAAMKLPKQDRDRAFQLLKRRGIMLANMRTLSSGSSASTELLRERSKQSLEENELIYCSKCFGFFVKKYFNRHRRSCYLNKKSTYLPHAVKPEIGGLNSKDDERFASEILGSFHGDEVGRICRTDTEIVSYGKKKFRRLLTKRNSEKYEDKKSSIRSEMRRIGHLYSEFKQICPEKSVKCSSSLDMLKSENFYILEEAIERVTTKDDGTIKYGLRKEIGYSIKRLCRFLFGKFSVENQKENRNQVEDFLNVFNFFWSDIFGEAESSIVLQRQTQLRKPLNLPKQSEVQKLREFTLTELQKLTASEYEFIATSDYIKLRNLVASRLTLFNARRGGEPCCLQISQWIEADNNVWLGESNSTECKDPVEESLLKKFKIAYQVGKGQKLVPLLILDDCWEGIRKLIDPEIREQAGVHRDNVYVFPHTQYSLKHVGGWVVVTECCNQAGLYKNITATGMRHYVSTLYASLDIKESERETFFNHMGHSEMINKNVYQSPLARQTIVRVGKVLEQIDQGEVNLNTANVSVENNTELNVQLNTKGENSCGEYMTTCQKSPQIERRYKLWSIEDTEVIKTYFSQYILSTGNLETNRGPLPGVEELKAFCAEFPNILKDLSKKERIARVKTKIFNERKLAREKLKKAAGKGKQSKGRIVPEKKKTTTSSPNYPAIETTNKIVETEGVCYICRAPYKGRENMWCCNTCNEWYHPKCIGRDNAETPPRSETTFLCGPCLANHIKEWPVDGVHEVFKSLVNDEDFNEEGFFIKTGDAEKYIRKAFERCWYIVHSEGEKSEVSWLQRHMFYAKFGRINSLSGFGEGLFSEQAIHLLRVNLYNRFQEKQNPKAFYSLHNIIPSMANEKIKQIFHADSGMSEDYINKVLLKEAMVALMQEVTGDEYKEVDTELRKTEATTISTANHLIMNYLIREREIYMQQHNKVQ